jgi:hypothetical protein
MAFNSDYGGFGGSSTGGGGGGGQGVPITDPAVILLLTDNGNWTNNAYSGVTPISGQQTGDYYDSGTIRYWIVGDTGATRIPYANL